MLEEPVADTVNQILQAVITSGTGTRANIGVPAAGKTGTSQNYGNAWFVGYTPALSTAVWVGYPEGNVPMLGIHGVRAVAGGTIPARIWHDFMAAAPLESDAEVAGAGGEVENAARGGEELPNGVFSPPDVLGEGEDPVGPVVARGDRGKHLPDPGGIPADHRRAFYGRRG